jgi:hypothetical protein
MSKTEAAAWLADALGRSGERAAHIVYTRGRVAGLEPREIRAAARALGVKEYEGGRSTMWRMPRQEAT